MSLTFYWYPNCGTCKKAKKWLDDQGLNYETVHIVDQTPSEDELQELINHSEIPARKFFNTSGKKYREHNMKDKLKNASEKEMIQYLASDGMLIKRPIVTDGKKVTIGFKEEQFTATWVQ
ncbi:arsenate reductase family protein [Halobacillus amylolyticus]|uniref:Arsenate reductase family protein n=1 Tax=Halobacillus amylolyticus TaxID=2932259 RepID=A0ABY4HEF5_9BACI|nr:arsenate reductase family protein [Halobacillus amylolyticus]UOR11795.1 arsenate reductase family protein [Halobacillus amylolyticus]